MNRLLLILLAALSLLAGCASDSGSSKAAKTDPEGNSVSNIPWNRPQRWENQGQLGGMGNN
jgi:ABC-type glycerol-3-phosphate transport system substrate-binding protein